MDVAGLSITQAKETVGVPYNVFYFYSSSAFCSALTRAISSPDIGDSSPVTLYILSNLSRVTPEGLDLDTLSIQRTVSRAS